MLPEIPEGDIIRFHTLMPVILTDGQTLEPGEYWGRVRQVRIGVGSDLEERARYYLDPPDKSDPAIDITEEVRSGLISVE
ncbi:hypothetical protein [Terrihabitans sp. B22-R8]|uniref:hypothetical protein n=1 Tax=Terrihabitans sp. B22-R8 TaxID=3425128 RepID=UPI00403C2922